MGKVNYIIQQTLIGLIRGYRFLLSPFIGNYCRFTPTCSCFAEEAILFHGWGRGSLLTVWRLLRCHPFCAGGYDPVSRNK